MKETEKKERILKAITILAAYYEKELIPDVMDLYVEYLGKYDIKYIEKACKEFILTSKFMPKISEFEDKLQYTNELINFKYNKLPELIKGGKNETK